MSTPLTRLVAFGIIVLSAGSASANECTGKLIPINEFTPLEGVFYIKSRYGNYYLPNADCVTVKSGQRAEFEKLVFQITNSLPDGPEVAYVAVQYVKSYAISTQDRKFKVSRSKGWFLPGENGERKEVGRLDDEPIKIAASNWNGAFEATRMPEQFNQILGINWTAYLQSAGEYHSAESEDFWRISNELDLSKKIVGNGVFRFFTNTDATPSLIPLFSVTVQSNVKSVEFKTYSNMSALSEKQYEFQFE